MFWITVSFQIVRQMRRCCLLFNESDVDPEKLWVVMAGSVQIHDVDLRVYFWLKKNCLEIFLLGSCHPLFKWPVFLCFLDCHFSATLMQMSDCNNSPQLKFRELSLSGNWVLSPCGHLLQEKQWKEQAETLDSKKVINYESHPTALAPSLSLSQ